MANASGSRGPTPTRSVDISLVTAAEATRPMATPTAAISPPYSPECSGLTSRSRLPMGSYPNPQSPVPNPQSLLRPQRDNRIDSHGAA